jgi:hypothetical protein
MKTYDGRASLANLSHSSTSLHAAVPVGIASYSVVAGSEVEAVVLVTVVGDAGQGS